MDFTLIYLSVTTCGISGLFIWEIRANAALASKPVPEPPDLTLVGLLAVVGLWPEGWMRMGDVAWMRASAGRRCPP